MRSNGPGGQAELPTYLLVTQPGRGQLGNFAFPRSERCRPCGPGARPALAGGPQLVACSGGPGSRAHPLEGVERRVQLHPGGSDAPGPPEVFPIGQPYAGQFKAPTLGSWNSECLLEERGGRITGGGDGLGACREERETWGQGGDVGFTHGRYVGVRLGLAVASDSSLDEIHENVQTKRGIGRKDPRRTDGDRVPVGIFIVALSQSSQSPDAMYVRLGHLYPAGCRPACDVVNQYAGRLEVAPSGGQESADKAS